MALEQILSQWGLPALVAGGFLEGETFAIAGGLLAHRGVFPWPLAALAVGFGGLLADQAAFFAGARLAQRPRVARALAGPRATWIRARLAGRPLVAAFVMRWLYGLRTVSAATLGASGAAWPGVALVNAVSALIWGAVFTGLGYGLSHGLMQVFGPAPLHRHLWPLLLAGLALAIGLWLWRRQSFIKEKAR